MVTYFPYPFPDECLYSIVSRYVFNILIFSPKQASQLLFNSSNVKASVDLPAYLNALYDNTNHICLLTPKAIAQHHTLYPFYMKFISERKRRMILNAMMLSDGSDIHTSIGINASKINRSRFPAYCSKCTVEDEKKFGIPYFHNSHQIPDVKICLKHGCYLKFVQPTIRELNTGWYISPMRAKDDLSSTVCENKLIRSIAENFVDILKGTSSFDVTSLEHYKKITEKGFTRGNSLDRAIISDSFVKFFGQRNLEQILKTNSQDYGWVSDLILNPSRVFHPLKQILVFNYIESLSLFQAKRIDHPFGSGPWPCINKTSNHFMKNTVTLLKTHTDPKSKRVIGEFSCECGMVYTKSFLRKNNGKKIEFVRIKEWGHVWQEKFKSEIPTGKSLRELSRTLGVDPSKIKKMIKPQSSENISGPDLFNEKYRESWLQVLKESPWETIAKCRLKAPDVYTWLYRNDRKWLLQINSEREKIDRQVRSKLNWGNLDNEILAKIQRTVKNLKDSKNSSQITKTLLAKLTNTEQYLLNKSIARLPKTNSYVKGHVESLAKYQFRRFKSATEFYADRQEPLKTWKIVRKAGLKNSPSPLMLELIESVTKKI